MACPRPIWKKKITLILRLAANDFMFGVFLSDFSGGGERAISFYILFFSNGILIIFGDFLQFLNNFLIILFFRAGYIGKGFQ